MTARSGYLELNSLGATSGAGIQIRNSLNPRITRPIVPSQPGTLTHIELPMWRTGTPVNFDAILWRQNTGDPYSIPTTGNNWEIVAVAHVDASSVTQTAQSNLQRIKVPVNTPVFIDDIVRRTDAYNQDFQGAVFGYALTLEQTTLAQSNDSVTNVMNIHIGNNTFRSGFGVTYVNTTLNQANAANPPAAHMFGLYGHFSVSSIFKDKCENAQKWIDRTREGAVNISGTNSTEISGGGANFIVGAQRYSVVGSKISRVLFQAAVRGDRSFRLICNLYTVDVNTNHPGTCIGSSTLVDVATLSAAGYLLGLPLGLHFVFSGGVDIVSGNNYYFVVQAVNSVQHSSNSYFVSLQKYLTGVNTVHRAQIAPQSTMGPGLWATGSAVPLMAYWYVDSETQNIYDTDYPSAPSSDATDGDRFRLFPGATGRLFPTFVSREQFRP